MTRQRVAKRPEEMTLAEIETEMAAILEHQERVSRLPACTRDECTGRPHIGAPYHHEPRRKIAATPIEHAQILVDDFNVRPHLQYLSDRIAQAVTDVENGIGRRLIVEMPPRTGKTFTATQITPSWVLTRHPDWPIVLSSYSSDLATSWSLQIRRWVESGKLGSGVAVAPDSGRAEGWETTEGGKLTARSLGGGTTGFGAKVLIIDDPHKDFIEAHSARAREDVWQWWLGVGSARLHRPALVIVIMTRWHEDDLAGRLLSTEYPGDPDDWEVIRFPAIAEEDDVLGREPGQPLYSPLTDETEAEAIEQWENVRRDVGSYTWSALYQQRPAPPEGAIFAMSDWRFWTTDPERASHHEDGSLDPDGTTILLDPATLSGGEWVDSWDTSFKGGENSDFVVGQRWVRVGANRYLMAQKRGRWTFTRTVDEMTAWAKPDDPIGSPFGHLVHRRLIEDTANGPAIINTLKDRISGLKPISPRASKEARARAISPEVESHNVLLPHPDMPGYEWVGDLLDELREFPNSAHDDQVDALTQALLELRGSDRAGGITVPRVRGGNRLTSGYGRRIPGR